MMANCPVCGKLTCIHWPEFWVYRRGDQYLCSENCMIVFDTQEFREKCGWIENWKYRKQKKKGSRTMANHKLTLEQKKKAVEIYKSGGDQLAWLEKCGSKNPSAAWFYIRKKLMDKEEKENPVIVVPHDDIEKAASYPEKTWMDTDRKPVTVSEAMQNMKDATDKFFGESGKSGLFHGTQGDKDANRKKIRHFTMPAYTDGFEIVGIRGEFGVYRANDEVNYFEFCPFGGELCMSPEDWKGQLDELNRAMNVLGVKL